MNDLGWTNPLQQLHTIFPEIVLQPGANSAQLAELEQHIGISLPQSFKALLKISNGLSAPEYHADTFLGTDQIEWFSVDNSDWIDIYNPIEEEDDEEDDEDDDIACLRSLSGMLQITSSDETVILLNPAVRDEHGDWQAVLLANWVPGTERYSNLQELITKTFDAKSKTIILSTSPTTSDDISGQDTTAAPNDCKNIDAPH